MRNGYKGLLLTAILICTIGAYAQNNVNALVPSGTQISVRTDQAINVKGDNTNNNTNNDRNQNSNGTYNGSYGDQLYSGTIASDVMDSQGRVAIPSGSPVQLAVVNTGDKNLTLDLRTVTVNGQTFTWICRHCRT